MPELAEVEYFRHRWDAGLGQVVIAAELHPTASIFRETEPALFGMLTGARLERSECAAKQMVFVLRTQSDETAWLGIHLGMTGELLSTPVDHSALKSDHLILRQETRSLVFRDPRMFGQARLSLGSTPPVWWTSIAPSVLSAKFTAKALQQFLQRRAKTPIKAALLMQERFPGIGNWMADEILWRCAIHPRRLCGSLSADDIQSLWKETRWVARNALRIIGQSRATDLPDPPANWLFQHRWQDGGTCPITGQPLRREEIGGRTTCWSPARQLV